MKKLLIGVLIVLLVVLSYVLIFKGISIGNFKILSAKQIAEESDKLTAEIQEVQKLMLTDYQNKNSELDRNITQMLKAKDEYNDLASVSTEGQLAKASQQEVYASEFLYTKIGRYATAEGVLLKIDQYAGDTGESDVKNISYTVTGPYIAIINFISDIEDDSKLGFRIENFKMVPSGESRVATFSTNNIRIKQEQTTTEIQINTYTEENTENPENAENTAETTNNENINTTTDTNTTSPDSPVANTTDTTVNSVTDDFSGIR